MNRCTRPALWILSILVLSIAGLQVAAFDEPDATRASGLAAKEFRHPDFELTSMNLPISELSNAEASRASQALASLSVMESSARVDPLGGRFETLLPSHPLIAVRTPAGQSVEQRAADARQAFQAFLQDHQQALAISTAELAPARVTVHSDGTVIQLFLQRKIGHIPVRGSYISGVINHGNLNLFSTMRWGNMNTSTTPRLSEGDALRAAQKFLSPYRLAGSWDKHYLELIPTLSSNDVKGGGYGHRLVWALHPSFGDSQGHWEILVDAHSGQVVSFQDMNHYAEAKGGVYPVTNDGVVPDGVEQIGWPMPWMNVSTTGGTVTTDTGGNLAATGSMTGSFTGPYVRISDNCGTSSLTQTDGLDFGASAGDDCTTPGFGGAGNTHSGRTGFYELNRIKEMGRSHLPSNSWLQQQLTSNMNINNTCNAFWGGGTVNFYRSGGGCANTGEIAGVFDHEWGHGMDDNDANPSIAGPSGEGIADLYAALRLNDSCIGRNFLSTPCTGFGDPCLTCSGVRDIDYDQRQSGNPHTFSWSNSNCSGQVHCVGSVYGEAVWNVWKRELPSAPYNMNSNTAHELTTRLVFIGGGAVGTWFSGSPPNGGCGGSGGYLNFLAADDDDGNINNGTPHMQAIYDGFNTQEIACNTPTVQDSGCAGAPSSAPNVTATPGDNQVALSWGSVSGAAKYQVFRAEGIFACGFGKVKVADITGTSFTDTNLQNGRDYSYTVVPIGSSGDSCMGPASACDTVQPAGVPPTPDFSVSCSPSSLTMQQGSNGNTTCTVTALNGYTGSVNLSCSGAPAGVSCAFSPSSLSPTGNSTLTVSAALSQATGTFNFDVAGDDGSLNRTDGISVTVTPEGQNGPQNAVYDAGLGAPRCSLPGSSCDSTTLVDSRSASLSPAEPNASNTLDSCTDGTSGAYHSDESNDRLVVSTLDSLDFSEGATVEVAATVYGWSTGTSDHLDLYYAADANAPVWTLITTIDLTSGGVQTLTAQYTLPAGGLQAVRANFRYNGSASSCSGGNYDDADDLVFAVNGAGPSCVINDDCSDGLFCNGTEVCNAGTCEAGAAVTCDDGISCTVDSCNEGTDSCDFATNNSLCDNGLFCDGTETCSAILGCQAGSAPNCDDGVGCTVDSCNEGTDSCDNGPNDSLCDNGLFCDGSEVCNLTLDCQDAPDPCTGPGQTCNETGDVCEGGTGCLHEVDFEAGQGGWTNGADTCSTGSFVLGSPDATAWQVGGGNPGSAFYTQPNPGGIGTNDVDGGTCEALSPVVGGAGQAAVEVSFDYFHGQRDAGDDANDGFTVELLDNGSVVQTLVNIGDVTNNAAWTSVSTTVNNPGNLQLRVRATDATGGGDIVEGGIDNVSICPTTPATCTVDDDFEGGTAGWNNDAASTCSTGDYVEGNPTNPGGGQQIVGSHSGTTSIFTGVNTAAGTNDVDGGNCILSSPSWSVTNSSTLSVWYWHGQRDAGDDATGDFFLLEYSTNGGASWSTLASNGDSASTATWTEATTAIPAGSDVQLRVHCSDGSAGGDLVECGIDDVSICE